MRKIENVRLNDTFRLAGETGTVVAIGRKYVQAKLCGVIVRVDPLSLSVVWER